MISKSYQVVVSTAFGKSTLILFSFVVSTQVFFPGRYGSWELGVVTGFDSH